MSSEVFSGPVKAGTIRTTTGSTVGTDMSNTGYVLMSKSVNTVQDNLSQTNTGIVVPAHSQIVDIRLYVTTAWTRVGSGVAYYYVGKSTASLFFDYFFLAAAYPNTSVPVFKCNSSSSIAAVSNLDEWKDVGSSDIEIATRSSYPGDGVGVLTVQYIQNNNLT